MIGELRSNFYLLDAVVRLHGMSEATALREQVVAEASCMHGMSNVL